MLVLLRWTIVLICCVSCICFNVDTDNYVVYNGPSKGAEFGFSSGMFRNSEGVWLLVGAPKSNSSFLPHIIETGSFYKCPVNFSLSGHHTDCKSQLPYGDTTDTANPYTFKQQKQLFGYNLQFTGRKFLACAPKYKLNAQERSTSILFTKGRCGVGSLDDLNMSLNYTFFRLPMATQSAYIYGMGITGLSTSTITMRTNGFDSVLGTPGVYDGKGGFILMTTADVSKFRAYKVQDDVNLASSFNKASYLGYSVGAGRFGDSALTIVAGAPHYRNDDGDIGLIVLLDANTASITFNMTTRAGLITGCGFGASLIVSDVNGDGLHDILVGSPFYTNQTTDQGLVQVYYGTGDKKYITETYDSLTGSEVPYGRFGAALSEIGDINVDGLMDIAIGAPFENDQRGALYIYNGQHGNINTKYSQRIPAESLDSGLRAFGFYISAPFDADGNTYNDMSVGAFLSDQTVLLRTRPIVKLDRHITLSPENIPLDPAGFSCKQSHNDSIPCTTVRICFIFSGQGVPNGIGLTIGLSLEMTRKMAGKSSRLDFYVDGKNEGTDFMKSYVIQTATDNCRNITARASSIGREFFVAMDQPVDFKLNYSLNEDIIPGEVLPILNNIQEPEATFHATFDNGCGAGPCRANLQLSVSANKKEIIIKATNDMSLNIILRNLGQSALATRIVASSNAKYLSYRIINGTEQVACKQNGTDSKDDVACDFKYPFFQNKIGAFNLTYDVSAGNLMANDNDLNNMDPAVSFNLSALTSSFEIDPSNNDQMIKVPVRIVSDIILYGQTNLEQTTLSPNSDRLISFVHTFTVYNGGPSPLPQTIVTLMFPKKTTEDEKEIILVENDHIKVAEVSNGIYCRILSSNDQPSTGIITEHLKTRQRRAVKNDGPSQTIQNITCESHSCVYIECSLQQLDIFTSASVQVAVNITEKSISFQRNIAQIQYVTAAEIHKPRNSLVTSWSNDNHRTEIRMDIFPAREVEITEEIDIWVIIVGCLGGLVLFVAFGLLLWKCGFFKRNKKKELQALKRKSFRQSRAANAQITKEKSSE